MTPFERAFQHTVGVEGGYSDDPSDSGGKTKFGITEAVARENGYQGDMKDLPLEFAHDVYRRKYWDLIHLDQVAEISEAVAAELFDTGVNTGVHFAALSFQAALNAFNRQQQDYKDIVVDGLIGPATLTALRGYFAKRGVVEGTQIFLSALNSLQGAFYIRMAEKRPKDEDFMYGWFRTRVVA